MSGPLDGVTLIELGQLIAGPFCGQLMADYGADVIKVEDPNKGDPLRDWGLGYFAPLVPITRFSASKTISCIHDSFWVKQIID